MNAIDLFEPAVEAASLTVRVRKLRRQFADRTVLNDLDLEVRAGEFVALLGASGCGKSTFLRILAGLDTGAQGEIEVPRLRGVAFQDARLLPWKRVWNNVALGLSWSTAAKRVDAALEEVGLTSHARSWPATLSGGEAQRVALARALIRDPALLLLDEPFGALDALTRIKMQSLLLRLCRRHGPAVLLVTHDVDEALFLADRILVLAGGRFVLDRQFQLGTRRYRSDPKMVSARRELLDVLGVKEDDSKSMVG
jgi:sulfonate transport system ATP-binding protein